MARSRRYRKLQLQGRY